MASQLLIPAQELTAEAAMPPTPGPLDPRPRQRGVRPAIRRAISTGFQLRSLALREHTSLGQMDLPWRRRLWLWRHGFLSDTGVTYDLSDARRKLYVTDLEWALRTPFINGIRNPTLNDKLIFFHTMRSLGASTPAIHGLVTPTRIAWQEDSPGPGLAGVLALLEREGELVLKPAEGGKGQGINFVAVRDGALLVNGSFGDEALLGSLLVPGTLICQRVHQAAYAARIFAGSPNTLRVMTMWDLDRGEPFIAFAGHRFGTSLSAPVDNVGRGGIHAGIDAETGVIGHAFSYPPYRPFTRLAAHPDTGAPIEGTAVPGWAGVRGEILGLARRLGHVPYVGWDVLVGDATTWIIEGNNWPDTAVQAFGPLLEDPRVARFYRYHRVIRR